ncbi:hypothetical protein BROUX41_004307 [Berkeleyomyces rouxiae]|uniref:uncharacterized protein n=1 Tax=Berkeleyomyces rouxiae TaxID=2035830 RepID=UPI003B805F86
MSGTPLPENWESGVLSFEELNFIAEQTIGPITTTTLFADPVAPEVVGAPAVFTTSPIVSADSGAVQNPPAAKRPKKPKEANKAKKVEKAKKAEKAALASRKYRLKKKEEMEAVEQEINTLSAKVWGMHRAIEDGRRALAEKRMLFEMAFLFPAPNAFI